MNILDFIFNHYEVKKYNTNYTENINRRVTNGSHCINPNLVNYDGLTILHLLLYNYKDSYDPYIKKIIPKTNLNSQDNLGNTILHLFVEYNLWEKFTELIIQKPLRIYIKNNQEKTVLDTVPVSSVNKFVDMIIQSYSFYLKNKNANWLLDWQNECMRNITDESCYKYIKESIISNKLSVPLQKNKQNITIEINKTIHFSTFAGSQLDIMSGFKYLIKKYKNVTTIFNPDMNYNPELEKYNEMVGINMSTSQHLIHFEILWIFQRLFFPPNFVQGLKSIITSNKYEYIILPIGIILANGTHSNALVYNIKNHSIERFEPHGSDYPYQFNYNPELFDELLKSKMNNILNDIYQKNIDISYLKPSMYLPKIGFQTFENMEAHINKNIGDPNGFCTLWCIWYLEYRLKYADMFPSKIIKKIIKEVRSNNLSFRNIIRNYSVKITDLRDTYLGKINRNINDYLNNRLTENERKQLVQYILEK